MLMDVKWTYPGDHLTIYTNVKSLRCTLEINIVTFLLYLNKTYKRQSTSGSVRNIIKNKKYFFIIIV